MSPQSAQVEFSGSFISSRRSFFSLFWLLIACYSELSSSPGVSWFRRLFCLVFDFAFCCRHLKNALSHLVPSSRTLYAQQKSSVSTKEGKRWPRVDFKNKNEGVLRIIQSLVDFHVEIIKYKMHHENALSLFKESASSEWLLFTSCCKSQFQSFGMQP